MLFIPLSFIEDSVNSTPKLKEKSQEMCANRQGHRKQFKDEMQCKLFSDVNFDASPGSA